MKIDLERYFASLDASLDQIIQFEELVIANVQEALSRRVAGDGPENDDDVFSAFTAFVGYCRPRGLSLRAVSLWSRDLCGLVDYAEQQMRGNDPNVRIHKGSPLYNVGLSFFAIGNFERAYQFIAEAGIEDERSNRGPRTDILIGNYELSRQILITPLEGALLPSLASDYKLSSRVGLDGQELNNLFNWLVLRSADAFQTLIALHRFSKLQMPPINEASAHIQVRAIAELVVAVESSMRRWQVGMTGLQLHARTEQMLLPNPAARTQFQAFHVDFCNSWAQQDRESAAALEWVISQTISRLAVAANAALRVGISTYLVVRLRNNLMHILDDNLSLYTNSQSRTRIAGMVLGVIRISKHGDEQTLNAIA